MQTEKARARKILKILRSIYPDVKTQLFYQNPFQLLIATILSAQCTDRQVNSVTPALFERLSTPHDFAAASLKLIESYIRPTGFFHNKARHIKNCSRTLVERHNGSVPPSITDLVKLPGVGRKTANVVLGAAFGIPGMVVDTHVARISRRLTLTRQKDPVKIEFDLMDLIPKKDWNDFGLLLIYFGRDICTARKPGCPACPLYVLCEFPDKTAGRPAGSTRTP